MFFCVSPVAAYKNGKTMNNGKGPKLSSKTLAFKMGLGRAEWPQRLPSIKNMLSTQFAELFDPSSDHSSEAELLCNPSKTCKSEVYRSALKDSALNGWENNGRVLLNSTHAYVYPLEPSRNNHKYIIYDICVKIYTYVHVSSI